MLLLNILLDSTKKTQKNNQSYTFTMTNINMDTTKEKNTCTNTKKPNKKTK